MKLRNKKTGEIVGLSIFGIELNIRKENQPIYHSLTELNEEWEDYDEESEKEAIAMLEQIAKALDKINANIHRFWYKEEE